MTLSEIFDGIGLRGAAIAVNKKRTCCIVKSSHSSKYLSESTRRDPVWSNDYSVG